MARRTYKSPRDERLAAIHAALAKQGLTSRSSKAELREAAKRQKVTQRFLKEMNQEGRIAHVNTLANSRRYSKVWRLKTGYGPPPKKKKKEVRKHMGEGWEEGRVRVRNLRSAPPFVKILWEGDESRLYKYTSAQLQSQSIVQLSAKRGKSAPRKTAKEKMLDKYIERTTKAPKRHKKRMELADYRKMLKEFEELGYLPKGAAKRAKG
jgi:hypothetical protein